MPNINTGDPEQQILKAERFIKPFLINDWILYHKA